MIRWFRLVGWRHLVAIVAVLFSLFPIVFVLSAALNPLGTLSSTDLTPTGFTLDNFVNLFDRFPFLTWYFNSILIATVSALTAVMLSALAAYAFSRMRFRGRRTGLMSLLLIQMFPQFLAIVAIFLTFTRISEYWPAIGFNTPWALILLYMGGALGVNTWLMKGFFDTIPAELDESARVDGATPSQVFWGVVIPLAVPVLAVVALISYIFTLNEFVIASAVLQSSDNYTLVVGLRGFISEQYAKQWGPFAAGVLLAAIPPTLLFLALQRFIVEGLTRGAVKG